MAIVNANGSAGARQSARVRAALNGIAVIAGLLVCSVVLTSVVLSLSFPGSTISDWLHISAWLAAMTFRAPLLVSGGAATGSSSFVFQPPLLFAATLVAFGLLARQSNRFERAASLSEALARSAITGVTAGVLVTVVAVVSTYVPTSGSVTGTLGSSTASVGPDAPLSFVATLAFAFLATAIGYLTSAGGIDLLPPPWKAQAVVWNGPLRDSLSFLLWIAVGGFIVDVIGSLLYFGQIGGLRGLLGLVFLTPSLALMTGLIGAGAQLGASLGAGGLSTLSGSAGISEGFYNAGSNGIPVWLWLLVLVPVAALVVVSLRTYRNQRPAMAVNWGVVARCATAGAVMAAVCAYLMSASLSGQESVVGNFNGTASIGLSFVSVVIAAGVWCGLVVVVGPSLAAWCWQSFPGPSQAVSTFYVSTGGAILGGAETSTSTGLLEGGDRTGADVSGGAGQRAERVAPAQDDVAVASAAPRARQPMSKRTKQTLISSAIVVVLILIGFGATQVVNGSVFSPAAVVTTYLTGLADGNAPAALATGEFSVHGPLLTDGALKSDLIATPIGNIHVGQATIDGQYSTVQASYTMGNTPVQTEFSLIRTGSTFLIFNRWKLTSTVDIVQIQGSGVSLNGVGLAGGTQNILVFPGTRLNVAAQNQDYDATLAGGQTQAPLVPGRTVNASVSISLSSTGRSAVITALNQSFAACATSTSLTPAGCPFSDSPFYQGVTGVTWTVNTSPSQGQPSLTYNNDGTVSVSGSYDVSCSYAYNDPVLGTGNNTDDVSGYYTATVSLNSSPPTVSWQ